MMRLRLFLHYIRNRSELVQNPFIAIPTAMLLLQILPCEHLHLIPYNPLVAMKNGRRNGTVWTALSRDNYESIVRHGGNMILKKMDITNPTAISPYRYSFRCNRRRFVYYRFGRIDTCVSRYNFTLGWSGCLDTILLVKSSRV